jgi:hypothetical protein
MRARQAALAIAVSTISLAGAACRRGDAVKPDEAETSKKQPDKANVCPVPEGGRISSTITFPAGCTATIEGPGLIVEARGTLTLEPGVDLAFGPEARLRVTEGTLLAKGSETAAVKLHASSKKWRGVAIEGGQGSSLVRTEIADVGLEGNGVAPQAALSIEPGATRVVLAWLSVRRSERSALYVGRSGAPSALLASALASAEWLDFDTPTTPSTPSIVIGAKALGAISSARVAAPVQLIDPVIEGPTSWPKLSQPIIAPQGLVLGAGRLKAELQLADGTTLLVAPGHSIQVGAFGAASLRAHFVRFDSAAPKPAPGDWAGIELKDGNGSELLDCRIAHAGTKPTKGAPEVGVIDVTRGRPKIERTKFVDDVGLAIRAWVGCEAFTSKTAGNDFGALTPCVETAAKLAAELDKLDLQLLGALNSGAPVTNSVLTEGGPVPDMVAGPGTRPATGSGKTVGGGGGDVRRGGTVGSAP